jgi:hypothetical protein
VRFNVDVQADDAAGAHSATNPANYLLLGTRSGPVAIHSVDYDRASRTITLHFDALVSDRYVLLVRPEIQTVAGKEMDAPYTAIFHLAMAPQVTATTPADGQLVPPGLTEVKIAFDRPMFTGQGTEAGSALRVDNYHLLGQNGGPVGINSVTYDDATHTATLHVDTLPADFYQIVVETTLQSADAVNLAQPFLAQFTQLADVTGDFRIDFTGTRTNRTDRTEVADLSLTNISDLSLYDSMLLVFDKLTPADAALLNPSGQTADGNPYVTLGSSYGGDNRFAPGESLPFGSVAFSDPSLGRLDLNPRLLAYPTVRNHLPTIASQPVRTATVGQTYTSAVAGSDVDGDHLLYFLEDAPAGMVIDHESGTITWVPLPGTPDQVHLKARVYEDSGDFATQEYFVSVTDPNQPPVLQPIGNRRAVPGQTVSFVLSATDPEGAQVTYYASNLPEGATFDAPTGAFTWQPAAEQTGAFVDLFFAASDGTRISYQYVAITVTSQSGTVESVDRPDQFDEWNITATLDVSGDFHEGQVVTATVQVTGGVPAGAPVSYSIDWGDGQIDPMVTSTTDLAFSAPHTYKDNDNGSGYTISVTLTDPSTGDTKVLTKVVSITNLPPTASLTNNGPVDSNYPVSVAFTNQTDPSSIDASRFHYSIALDQSGLATTYAAATDGASKVLEFADRGSHTIYGRIFDKDGGYFDCMTTVVVNAPYYGFTVVGVAGPGMQLSTLGDSPSINDAGTAAFTAYFDDASGIFANDGSVDPYALKDTSAHITRSDTLSTRDFGRAASINDYGDVAGRLYVKPNLGTYLIGYQVVPGPYGIPITLPEYVTIANPPLTAIRVWNASGDVVRTLDMEGGTYTNEELQNILNGQADVNFLLNFTDINDAGVVAYTLTHEANTPYELWTGASRPLLTSNLPPDQIPGVGKNINFSVDTSLPFGSFSHPRVAEGMVDPSDYGTFLRDEWVPALHNFIGSIQDAQLTALKRLWNVLNDGVDAAGALAGGLATDNPFELASSLYDLYSFGQSVLELAKPFPGLDAARSDFELKLARLQDLRSKVLPYVLYQDGNDSVNKAASLVLKLPDWSGQAPSQGGAIVIATDSSPIFGPNASNTPIAKGFSRIGRNPGIGKDGTAVAFMGTRKDSGEDGIFLSIPTGQNGLQRKIHQIVGRQSGPNGSQILSIDPKDSLGVTSVDAVGGVTVAFVATIETPTGELRRGIFSVRVTGIDTDEIQVSKVFSVVEVGDHLRLPNLDLTVASLAVDNLINDSGQIVFWASSADGRQAIVIATPPDISSNDAVLQDTDKLSFSYSVHDTGISHPFRVDVFSSPDRGPSNGQGTRIASLEIDQNQILTFNAAGQQIGTMPAGPGSLWDIGPHLVTASAPGLESITQSLYLRTLANADPAHWIPEQSIVDNSTSEAEFPAVVNVITHGWNNDPSLYVHTEQNLWAPVWTDFRKSWDALSDTLDNLPAIVGVAILRRLLPGIPRHALLGDV